MILALARKELREHGLVLAGLYAICALGFAGQAISASREGSAFVALRQFTLIFASLAALVVNNRLVVREYSGRTQLFLETLPVTRAKVIAVKLALGSLLVLAPLVPALAICALVAARFEPVTPRYLMLVGARAFAFALGFHALAFLAGLLGRLRVGVWMALLLGWFTLEEIAKVDVKQMPLMRLVGPQMPFERHLVPWADLGGAAILAAIFLAAAFAIALARDGTVASQLARRMKPQEKVLFFCIALGYLFAASIFQHHWAQPRFALAETVHAAAGRAAVAVGTGEGLDQAGAERLGRPVARDLGELQEYLQLEELPAVFLLPNRGLDADVFLRAKLDKADGVVLQAALANPALDPRELRAFVAAQVLGWSTRGRAWREPRRWLLDGFTLWWLDRDDPDGQLRERMRACAAPGPLTREALGRWLSTREELGACLSDALAWRLTATLARELGPQRFQAFAREALGRRPPEDARAALEEKSLASLLEGQGASLEQLLKATERDLAADRARFSADLARRAALQPALSLVPLEGGRQFEVRHSLRAAGASVPYTLFYKTLGPWTGELDPEDLSRFDTTGEGVLPATFTRGERAFTAFEVRDPVLECAVRLDARRWEAR